MARLALDVLGLSYHIADDFEPLCPPGALLTAWEGPAPEPSF